LLVGIHNVFLYYLFSFFLLLVVIWQALPPGKILTSSSERLQEKWKNKKKSTRKKKDVTRINNYFSGRTPKLGRTGLSSLKSNLYLRESELFFKRISFFYVWKKLKMLKSLLVCFLNQICDDPLKSFFEEGNPNPHVPGYGRKVGSRIGLFQKAGTPS
jgi:hypothetical protein